MLITETRLRSIIRETILSEQAFLSQYVASDLLSSRYRKLEKIKWEGKTYKAMGYLLRGDTGNDLADLYKGLLRPDKYDIVFQLPKAQMSAEDAVSLTQGTGPLEMLKGQVRVHNAGKAQRYDADLYNKKQDSKFYLVSIPGNASGLEVVEDKVDYGVDSAADIALEVGSYVGMIPGVGNPVDLASAVLAVIKDPPDYLLGALCVICSAPALGLAAGAGRIAARRILKDTTVESAEAFIKYFKELDIELTESIVEKTRKYVFEALDGLDEQIRKLARDRDIFGVCALTEAQGRGGCADSVAEGVRRIKGLRSSTENLLDSILITPDSVVKNVHYSKSQMLDFFENDIAYLRSIGVTPVEGGGKTFIGAGKFGRVYNVVYEGKPAVAKIVGEGGDINVWKKIVELSSEMPEELKRHIPDIKGFPGEGVIVMEPLQELPGSVRATIAAGRTSASDAAVKKYIREVSNFPLDDWFDIDVLIKEIKDAKDDLPLPQGWKFDDAAVEELKKLLSLPPPPTPELLRAIERSMARTGNLYDAMGRPVSLSERGIREVVRVIRDVKSETLRRWLRTQISKIDSTLMTPTTSNMSREYWAQQKINSIAGSMGAKAEHAILLKVTDPESFKALPAFGNTAHLVNVTSLPPEVRSFYRMLNWLKERGVTWRDVHEENVMISPATRELVLTDVGEFYL